MSTKSNWDILMESSAVFRNYVSKQLENEKIAAIQSVKAEGEAVARFLQVEASIRENKELKARFIAFKEKLATDENLRAQVGPKVVDAFNMLDLDGVEI